jgi:multimeric flavodoxin WrbA
MQANLIFSGEIMEIIAINGSPRKSGNTNHLLEAVLKPLKDAGWETEIVHIGGKNLHGCRGCYKCFEKQDRRCIFNTDEFNAVFEKMLTADAIVIGSSTYFADVTAEVKALIDRAGFVSMANGGLLAGKIGAGITAVRRGGSIHTIDTINHLFSISQMIIPGSTYWNMGFGLQPGEVLDDKMGMANMTHLGKAISWLGSVIKSAAIPYPVRKEGEEA